VEEVECEIKDRSRNDLPINENVLLIQVPPTRSIFFCSIEGVKGYCISWLLVSSSN
jgi:hypothetical protein